MSHSQLNNQDNLYINEVGANIMKADKFKILYLIDSNSTFPKSFITEGKDKLDAIGKCRSECGAKFILRVFNH
jgi:hypothetical protein